MSWFDTILYPLMWVVAWIMYGFHWTLTHLGLESNSGITWTLSIVGLVIFIRILLIPLFVRQIKAARGMQLLSPDLQALQKKYKGKTDPASREAMTRETMELYRKHGTNPFASCLPLLAQSPIFLALFRVLSNLQKVADGTFPGHDAIGPVTRSVAEEAVNARLFDAPISSWFLMPDATTSTKVVAVALIVLMSVTTFTTQKQLTQKNMPATALQGPMAQQQKMLLYVLPIVFALSGVSFPIGVLIYWSTTNLWSMGQQFYVIRRNPTPGSEAERMLKERRARKAAAKGIVLEDEVEAEPEKPKGQRQQPVRKDRARTRPAGGTAAVADGTTPRPGAGKPGAGKPGAAGRPGAAGKPAAGSSAARRQGGGTTGAARTTRQAGDDAGSGAKPSPRKPGTGTSAGAKPTGGKTTGGKTPGKPSGPSGAKQGGASKAPRTGGASGEAGDRSANRPAEAADPANGSGAAAPQDEQ